MSTSEAPERQADPTAAPEAAAVEVPPGIVAQNLGEYLQGWWARVRGGDSGLLPVIGGLLVIIVVFQAISPEHVFLSAGNLVNLFQQSAVFMVLAMAEGFVLLLGEIDLSVGYVAAVGAVIAVQLVQPSTTKWPWWAAIIAGLAACCGIGAMQGSLVTRLRVPSFVVTLAGLLVFNGVMLILLLLGPFSGYPSLTSTGRGNPQVLYNLMWGTIDPIVSWVAMVVIVGLLGSVILIMAVNTAYVASSELLVVSSRMEGGANVVCEAVRTGVPVAASRIPGNVGMLGADYAGYFALGDERALARLIDRARLDRAFYRRLQTSIGRRRHLFAPDAERRSLLRVVREAERLVASTRRGKPRCA